MDSSTHSATDSYFFTLLPEVKLRTGRENDLHFHFDGHIKDQIQFPGTGNWISSRNYVGTSIKKVSNDS